MGSRTAISAGVLALALAAVPMAAGPASAQALDCERGGGLLSGVTNSLCDLVDGVTDAVDGLTGDAMQPVTDGLDDTTSGVLGTVGEVAPTAKPSPSSGEQAEPVKTSDALLPETLDKVCLPVLACGDQSVLGRLTEPSPSPTGRGTRTATPTPTPSPSARDKDMGLPTEAPTPPANEPHQMDTDVQVIADEPVVDADDARIDLLWPNPLSDHLMNRMREQEVVRPTGNDSDALGTALTAVLLVSAILATRVVHQRRRREEKTASIPFEPLRPSGRHRLA